MNMSKLKFKLFLIYFLIYGSLACFFPFVTMYLQKRGLSYIQIGIINSTISLITVIFQPTWGYVADKYFNKRIVIIILLIGSAVSVYFFIPCYNFYPIFLCAAVFTIFQSPLCPINDAFCYSIIQEHKEIEFGKVRLMGSLGYALIALLLGVLAKQMSINIVFYSYILVMVICLYIFYIFKFKVRSNENVIEYGDLLLIIKNKRFIIMLFSAAVLNISIGANNSYISVLIQNTGGDVEKLGIVWFLIALSEIPAFFIGNNLARKYGVLQVYLSAVIFYALRFLLDSLCLTYHSVLLIQLLQGLTYPLYLITTLQYVNMITPNKLRTTAITVFSAISFGAGGFIGNIGAGILLEWINVFLLYKIMSIIVLASFFIGLFIIKQNSK